MQCILDTTYWAKLAGKLELQENHVGAFQQNYATKWCSDFYFCTKLYYLLGMNHVQFSKCGLTH